MSPRSEPQYAGRPRSAGRPSSRPRGRQLLQLPQPVRRRTRRDLNRVINTIQSTWGAYYERRPTSPPLTARTARYTAGWSHRGSFDDDLDVQPPGAAHGQCREARRRACRSSRPGVSTPRVSTARGRTSPGTRCATSSGTTGRTPTARLGVRRRLPRSAGGTPHSKYFLFNNVGSAHSRNIVVQTSMNLTPFAVTGQWNQATAIRGNSDVYADFLHVFKQSTPRYGGGGYLRTFARVRDEHLLPRRAGPPTRSWPC